MKTVCPFCQATNRLPSEHANKETATCGRCNEQLFTQDVINATAATLDKYLQDELPVIIDFWAPWCGPCLNFAQVYKEIASERSGKIRFLKINTEVERALSSRFGIRSIPTIMAFKQGQMVDMINGAMPKAPFSEWLDETV